MMLKTAQGGHMVDPSSRLGRELKGAEDFLAEAWRWLVRLGTGLAASGHSSRWAPACW
jgi:hypothetical protein